MLNRVREGWLGVAEANRVLGDFLPRFNARFGIPATQPGSAYWEWTSPATPTLGWRCSST